MARVVHSSDAMGTILAATDFSPCSRAAVQLATAVARRQGASLLVLHTVELPALDVPLVPMGATTWELESLTAAELALDRLASELRQSGIAVETRAILGTPVRLILDLARQVGAELIVLGTHGRKGAAHLFLGSVAEQVVRAAECPVLVAREGGTREAGTRDGRWDSGQPLNLAIVADGTGASEAALCWAGTAGKPLRGAVSLVRAYWPPQEGARYGIDDPWPGEQGDAELRRLLERDLRRAGRDLAGVDGASIRLRLAADDAPEGLCRDARDLGADALVMGIPKHARYLAPVSPAAILRAATVPVFCVPETIRRPGPRVAPVRSLLLACDLSESSKAAIVPAYGLLSRGGRVELCYVHAHGHPELLAGGADLADDERAAIDSDLRSAIPAEAAAHEIATRVSVIEAASVDDAILAAAERFDVDVVALGSHGRSGLARAVLGSVAEQVARRSRRPVLIVRGGASGT